VGRVVEDLKDENENYRRMVMETIDKVVSALGTADVDARLEELLIDGILYAFQEQVGCRGCRLGCRLHVWWDPDVWVDGSSTHWVVHVA
jgi:hypothetical protein